MGNYDHNTKQNWFCKIYHLQHQKLFTQLLGSTVSVLFPIFINSMQTKIIYKPQILPLEVLLTTDYTESQICFVQFI